jgi:hypothetical protein
LVLNVPEKDIFEREAKGPLPDGLQLLALEFELRTMTRQAWKRRKEEDREDEDDDDDEGGFEKSKRA